MKTTLLFILGLMTYLVPALLMPEASSENVLAVQIAQQRILFLVGFALQVTPFIKPMVIWAEKNL